MKKFILTLLATFLLTGCFGTATTATEEAPLGYQIFSNENLQITYPDGWELLTRADFTSDVPASTILSIRNKIKSDIFTANLNIISGSAGDATLEDMKKANLAAVKSSLLSFQELEATQTKNGLTMSFQGKKTPTEPVLNFKQLLSAKEGTGYMVTISYIPGEDESIVKALDEMLNSFSLK